MQYKTLKKIRTDKHGPVSIGEKVELTDAQAKMYLERGAIEEYDTKVVQQKPKSQKAKKLSQED